MDQQGSDVIRVVCQSAESAGDRAERAAGLRSLLGHAHVHDFSPQEDGRQGHRLANGAGPHPQERQEGHDNWSENEDASRQARLGQGTVGRGPMRSHILLIFEYRFFNNWTTLEGGK